MIKRTEGKIISDYGIKDYYKYYCNNSNNPIDAKKYNKIISEFNKGIVDLIINQSLEYTPPTLQFTFCVRKAIRIPRIKNNKLINTAPVDWKATKELWENNAEAKEKKIIIKFLNNHTSKFIFRIKALKTGNYFLNKKLYRFKACRSFQRNLAKRILDTSQDNFEAYKLY